jgi:hypothetical protein
VGERLLRSVPEDGPGDGAGDGPDIGGDAGALPAPAARRRRRPQLRLVK